MAAIAYGTISTIAQTSHPSPPERAPSSTISPGTRSCFPCPRSANRNDAGCSRRSDCIVGSLWQEVVADGKRCRVLQPLEPDHRVCRSGRVDRQRAQTEPPLDGALRHVDVLDTAIGEC